MEHADEFFVGVLLYIVKAKRYCLKQLRLILDSAALAIGIMMRHQELSLERHFRCFWFFDSPQLMFVQLVES